MSAPVTLRGARLIKDPELSFTNGGKPWVRFTVVTARRFKDPQTQEWQEQDTSFWDVVAYDKLAENIAEHCVKGSAVIVTGFMKQEKYQTKEGESRTVWKVAADDVGLSFKSQKAPPGDSKDYGTTGSPVKGSYNQEPPF